jgi:TonB-dependent SusC/RagA subfamily outer membrane receptor
LLFNKIDNPATKHSQTPNKQFMKKLFHQIARVIFLYMLLLLCFYASAQKKIHGIVTDTSGLPLAGATIEKLSNVAASSAGDGSFSIAAQSGEALIVSSVGRIKKFVQVGDSNFMTIVLDYDIKNLENVMVTGYGTMRQKDVTGAITKLSASEFSIGNITNPLQQVQGKMAGLVITNPSGDPNGEFTARIRGATPLDGQPPLVVIDGIAINDFYKAISTLNPNDVESYTILKDASAAAIYGARGANGVILITTKTSKPGKAAIEYNGWVSLENIARQMNVLNATQWRKVDTAMGLSGLDKGGNVDWQKTISRTAFSHNHMISFSGNSGQFEYWGSLGYIKQEGVILNTGKEVWTSRLMANQKSFNNKLETSIDISTSVTNRALLFDQWSTNQSRLGGSGLFSFVLEYLPVWPVYKPDGSYLTIANAGYFNPLFTVKEIIRKQRENFFQTAAKVNYEIIKGLKAGVLGTLSRADNLHDYYYLGIEERHDMPIAVKLSENNQSFTGDAHINYRKSFHKHTADVTGVYEYNKFNHDGPGGYFDKTEEKLISFLGRVVYNFNDRYILTANFRRDGSSKFGPANRWGNFPSLALAWRINDESFLKKLSWLNNLKLRISYGYTGNQANLPPNSYQLLYGPAGPFLNGGQILQSYANAMLARLYLNSVVYTGAPRWSDCIAACDAIINSNNYSLERNFFANFLVANEGSKENIFAIPFDRIAGLDAFWIQVTTLHYQSNLTFGLQSGGANGFCTPAAIYNLFDSDDVRRKMFLVGQQYVNQIKDSAYLQYDIDVNEPLSFDPDIKTFSSADPKFRMAGARCAKWEFNKEGWGNMSNDFAVYRLADIILMKAEAQLRNGDPAGALTTINQRINGISIRSRAGLHDFEASEMTLDGLLAERARELSWEGFRRNDLIRFGHFTDARVPERGVSENYKTLYPIPEPELAKNPCLKQNPGYY